MPLHGSFLFSRLDGQMRHQNRRQRRYVPAKNQIVTAPAKPLRILVPEGSSTSGREAVTILGLLGHHLEVCDPSPWCLARYSRFVKKFHRCPPLRDDPEGYLVF